MMKQNMKKGITLIEMAIVLIIVGLLLSIAFKGFDLLKTSSIVSEAAKIQKISSAVITFKSVHKRLPGDGCAAEGNPTDYCSGSADGFIGPNTDNNETSAFWQELYLAGLLSVSDRASEIGNGQAYTLTATGAIADAHKGIYITLSNIGEAIMCELDQAYGDGIHTVSKKDSLFMGTAGTPTYLAADTCEDETDVPSNVIDAAFLIYKY